MLQQDLLGVRHGCHRGQKLGLFLSKGSEHRRSKKFKNDIVKMTTVKGSTIKRIAVALEEIEKFDDLIL